MSRSYDINTDTHPENAPNTGSVTRILVAILLIVFILLSYHYISNSVDDTYITFRYSRNLAHGFGPVYNPGERVEGYSNFLFMALIGFGMLFGLDKYPLGPLWLAKLIGLAGGIWAVFMVPSIIKSALANQFRVRIGAIWVLAASLLLAAPATNRANRG